MSISSGAISTSLSTNQPLPMSNTISLLIQQTLYQSFRGLIHKEMMASISGMQSGLVTFQDVQANYGRDVEELFEQHEREQKLAEQYGVKTAFNLSRNEDAC